MTTSIATQRARIDEARVKAAKAAAAYISTHRSSSSLSSITAYHTTTTTKRSLGTSKPNAKEAKAAAEAAAAEAKAAKMAADKAAIEKAEAEALAEWERQDALPLEQTDPYIKLVRNIGISAHIDSGKTTLTERVLYYTGRIREMHEVKGTDGVGATMDSMDLERAKGITIKSAATHAEWNGCHINVIDTPGHVDFTIEVERSLRVLDGAVFVLCGVAGVQSQSITVDKQMRRYNVPRILFINKLDRQGANPWKAVKDVRTILQHTCAAVQIPMGVESQMEGIIDLITQEAIYYEGAKGDNIRRGPIPPQYLGEVEAKRKELIETLAEVDESFMDAVLSDAEISTDLIKKTIRKATLDLKFIPVFMGTALKNKGVQTMLDGVVDYLPNPYEVKNYALDLSKKEQKVRLVPDATKPLVALAFKLEEGQYGQLTYMRIYQGTLRRGDTITDVSSGAKVRVPRLCRMHSAAMEPLNEIGAGEIAAMSGIDCASGTTFTGNNLRLSLTSMHVPDPVISLAMRPVMPADNSKFSKAINRFQREDPTFRCHLDIESNETVVSGMGELHLEIYAERIRREYGVELVVGNPQVAYRETITTRADFNYLHKRQSGGSGQYGRVIGYLEPLPEGNYGFEFVNKCVGNNIPPEFYPAIEKGFGEVKEKGPLMGAPVQGVRVVLTDGQSHPVDSNEMAFKHAAHGAFAQAFPDAGGIILEPIMAVEVEVPSQFQGSVTAALNRRRGIVQDVEAREGGYTVIRADVPLKQMFGYSTDLRSATEGKGEFSMDYKTMQQVTGEDQRTIIAEAIKRRQEMNN